MLHTVVAHASDLHFPVFDGIFRGLPNRQSLSLAAIWTIIGKRKMSIYPRLLVLTDWLMDFFDARFDVKKMPSLLSCMVLLSGSAS
jgi:hypothetical protein